MRIFVGTVQGAAGNWAIPVVFENISDVTCYLFGYPGISWVTAAGVQIGAAGVRDLSVLPAKVTLEPGRSAFALVLQPTEATQELAGCTMAQAYGLKVYPPGNTLPVTVTQGGLDWQASLTWCDNGKTAATVEPIIPQG